MAKILASGRPAPSLDTPDLTVTASQETDWSAYLRDPRALGAVALLFLALYSLLARALRRGPAAHRNITLQ